MSEVEKTTMDEARELVSDPVLWPLVRDFLWDFAPQVHESWLEGLETGGAEVFRKLLRSNSGSTRRFVLEALGVEPFFHAFPKGDWSRLALLDGSMLLEVAKWLGALACADSLRRVMSGAAVRALKAALPGVYPDVFSFMAYFRGLPAGGEAEAPGPDEIIRSGCQMLLSVIHGVPEPLLHRLKLKLPRRFCTASPSAPGREMDAGAVLKLLRLKFPEAYSLCC